MTSTIGKQTNVVANTARQIIFFEANGLAFNYKTMQWTQVDAYDGLGLFTINDKDAVIGAVRYDTNQAVELQKQTTSGTTQTATIETASQDINEGGRAIIRGVRPLHRGGEPRIKVGVQDDLTDAVTYSPSFDINTRSGMANMRVEGRYMRVRIIFDDLTATSTIYGADVDYVPAGRV